MCLAASITENYTANCSDWRAHHDKQQLELKHTRLQKPVVKQEDVWPRWPA